MNYPTFRKKWIGKRVDTDGVPKGAIYQCVDLIKQYLKDVCGVPYGAYGNAVDYWANTAPIILKKMRRVKSSRVQQGDIVIVQSKYSYVDSKGHRVYPEHIVLADRKYIPVYPYFRALEQNGGSGSGNGLGTNAIRTRWIKRNTVIGVLRKK